MRSVNLGLNNRLKIVMHNSQNRPGTSPWFVDALRFLRDWPNHGESEF